MRHTPNLLYKWRVKEHKKITPPNLMFIPLISTVKSTKLNRRKGGGGGFKGFKTSINVAGSSKSATAYGSGGGRITTLPVYTGTGLNFGGRQVGGGDRKGVYGSR